MKMNFTVTGLVLFILVLVSANNASANLLTNGSFEQGAFGSPSNGFTSLTPGSTAITGWTVFNDQIAWGTTPNFTPITASHGSRFLDLQDPGATPAPYGGVSQTITTISGRLYRLTFDIGVLEQDSFDPNLGGPVTIRASGGSTSSDFVLARPADSGMHWSSYSLDFTATASSTAISLLGIGGENFLGVDNAEVLDVTAVPEPSSLLLGSLSLVGGIGLRGRANRRQVRLAK